MEKLSVHGHKRRAGKGKHWYPVKGYDRKRVPKGIMKLVGKTPIKLYPVQDEFGHRLGWSNTPGK